MTYEAFRIAFQDSEQAARAAYRRAEELARRLEYIRAQADKGQIQIGKSILGRGYEIAICPKAGEVSVRVCIGSFCECIGNLMEGEKS